MKKLPLIIGALGVFNVVLHYRRGHKKKAAIIGAVSLAAVKVLS